MFDFSNFPWWGWLLVILLVASPVFGIFISVPAFFVSKAAIESAQKKRND
jgi:phosphate/sulfate permease